MNTQVNTNAQPFNHVANLKSNRGLLKFIILSTVTFGIYGIIAMCETFGSINTIATRYDGKHTMNYFIAMLLGSITFYIYPIVYLHSASARIGNELQRRQLSYSFGATDFWLWNVLGSVIVVGPFIYMYKLFQAVNMLSADYNQRG